MEIEEKINKIRWCQTANGALFLLSTNDKTIKFWKVGKLHSLVAVSMVFSNTYLTFIRYKYVIICKRIVAIVLLGVYFEKFEHMDCQLIALGIVDVAVWTLS